LGRTGYDTKAEAKTINVVADSKASTTQEVLSRDPSGRDKSQSAGSATVGGGKRRSSQTDSDASEGESGSRSKEIGALGSGKKSTGSKGDPKDADAQLSKTGFRGRMVDKRGKPALGLVLKTWIASGYENLTNFQGWQLNIDHRTQEVDATGHFEFTGLSDKENYILAVAGGGRFVSAVFRVPALESSKIKDCGTKVVVLAGSISGKVVNPSGEIVAGATVNYGDKQNSVPLAGHTWLDPSYVPSTTKSKYIPLRSVLTINPNGTFSITGLAPGRYTLVADGRGYRDGYLKDIVLGEGTQRRGQIIELRDVVRARIKVVDGAGVAISGAAVVVASDRDFRGLPRYHEPLFDSPDYDPLREVSPTIKTDRNGVYTTKPLIENRYKVYVEANGYGFFQSVFELKPNGDADWTVRLNKGRLVRGVVVHSKTKKPLSGVTMKTKWLGGKTGVFPNPIVMETKAAGRFQSAHLSPGRHLLELTLNDFRSYSVVLKVDNTRTPLDLGVIELTLNPEVSFTILNEDDEPVNYAVVYMTFHSGKTLKSAIGIAKTLSEGKTTVTLPLGRASFKIKAKGYAFGVSSNQIIRNENNSIVIRLRRHQKVSGFARGFHGQALRNASLVFFRKGERVAFANCVTDSDGHYLIKSLAPGTYKVLLGTQSYLEDLSKGVGIDVPRVAESVVDIQLTN
ncbi:MAG: carboxypeptidase-like regulatory domain-containing protein, partial [Planctomycetota bacterium]|nr:carboxypeptidase-like regulatory domain-containing protein [Planctomycetota bacterium]